MTSGRPRRHAPALFRCICELLSLKTTRDEVRYPKKIEKKNTRFYSDLPAESESKSESEPASSSSRICFDGGDVPHILDVQAVGSGCCPLLHPDQVI
jgi:hypothetical protein